MNRIIQELIEPAKLQFTDDKFELEYSIENRTEIVKHNYTNNIHDEVMALLEYDFSFMRSYWKRLSDYYAKVKYGNNALYHQFFSIAKKAVNEIGKVSDPIGSLLHLFIQQKEELLQGNISLDAMEEIWYQLETAVYMQSYFSKVLTELCHEELVNENRKVVPMYNGTIDFSVEINRVYKNNSIDNIYLIKSIEEYYLVILQTYIMTNPMVAQCKYCDKYFVPKTKKVTLYCDRLDLKGISCKKLGAKNAFNNSINGDRYLHYYYTKKHRLQMYYSRCKLTEHSYIACYYDWIDETTPLLESYKAGNLDGEEFKKKIDDSLIDM